MIDEIVLLVVILVLVSLQFLISFSLNNLKRTKEDEFKAYNNEYISTGNNFALLLLISIFVILFDDLMGKLIDNPSIALLVTVFGGNALLTVLSILPILNIAENKPEKAIKVLKYVVLFFKVLFSPVSFIYLTLKKVFYKPLVKVMTEDDFLEIINQAEEEEGINESEKELIQSVLDFDNLKIFDIFTPRIDVIAIEISMTNDEITKVFQDSGYSRLPVYEKSIDSIVGTINHKDFYNQVLLENKPLDSIIFKLVEVPEYMLVKNLLSLLRTNKFHMAIVKDEYGGTLGIVTMEDILEELVGEIWDEHDKVLDNIKKINNNKYFILGSTYLDELEDIIDVTELDEEDYYTVNGWVLANLGKMGKQGDKFTYKNYEVIVRKANNKMILEVELNIKEEIKPE